MRSLIRLAELTFGWRGNSQSNLLEGWSAPEDGFTWSTGEVSKLWLHLPPPPPRDGTLFLELQCAPFTAEALLERQRLTVLVNDVLVGEEMLSHGGVAGFRVPEHAIPASREVRIELRHPDAARPRELDVSTDSRELGFAVWALRFLHMPTQQAASVTVLPRLEVPLPRDRLGDTIRMATGLEPDGLALQFDSLGHNCEFGLLQRHVGAEPLSLLRFAGVTMADLIAGLEDGFARAGDAVEVREVPTSQGRTEYMIHDETYNISLHTFQTTDAASAEQVRVQHTRRMRFLRDHFRTHLLDGDRIFVFQQRGRIMTCQALPLLLRLRDLGPSALLYVDQSPDLPSGAVEQLGHGFFHGSLEWMAPVGDAGALDLAAWLSLCANTYRLWKASGSF